MAKKKTFIRFKLEVKELIKKMYALDYEDFTDDDTLKQVFNDGDETPNDFVQRIGNKHDLDRVDTPFGG